CIGWTKPNRWVLERVITPHAWWKKRMIEEVNSTLSKTRLVLTDPKSLRIPDTVITGYIECVSDSKMIGQFRFIDNVDAITKFEGMRFMRAKANACPFTGEVVGYFNFTLFPLRQAKDSRIADEQDREAVTEFLSTLTYQSRGVVANLDNQMMAYSALQERCRLDKVFGEYGMDDGDCLLDTDVNSPYIVSLIETIQKSLDQMGIGFNAVEGGCKVRFARQTSHNPIRSSGYLPESHMKQEIALWIYNSIILDKTKLWGAKLIVDEDDS
ncbi:hypothetical protein SAMD00019534_114750, partial [Acytostelium subglobosum LB1]|uniref:hypothetical protein n=1 Tax=Acytostelium subglobosum LB1 TaxID=1410327 RepID=UPI0006449721